MLCTLSAVLGVVAALCSVAVVLGLFLLVLCRVTSNRDQLGLLLLVRQAERGEG